MPSSALDRKLTSILAADVVRYSELMAIAEEDTVERLRSWRKIIDELISRHGGRIFNTAGDAVMAEFSSAVEAVRCAISIQEEIRARNSEINEDRQMWLRIGVNVGDVMIDGDNLLGDGVNIAARMEGLAEAGGICISGTAFEHIKNKLSIAFDELGAQKVKNIPEPVPAYKIVPGKVSVKHDRRDAARGTNTVSSVLLGAGAVALLFIGLAGWFWTRPNASTNFPFDGEWEVSVHSRSGCIDNEPTTYPLTITEGIIDEPAQRFPKRGNVSRDGRIVIHASQKNGRPLNTQEGILKGDKGEGLLLGVRSECKGKITLTRIR